jgi:hypothetical protein
VSLVRFRPWAPFLHHRTIAKGTQTLSSLSIFAAAVSVADSSLQLWTALDSLAFVEPGHLLFTVTTVEMDEGVARRVYTNHPKQYPVSGTKPIHRDAWFDIVHDQRRSFVANTIEDIAKLFPDHELIASLGCGSVLNLPIFLRNELVATVNMLAAKNHYTPARVAAAEALLPVPASLCWALASQFDRTGETPD